MGSSVTEEYVYNVAGQAISRYGPYPAQTWVRDEIWAGNRHLATYANGTTYFHHADWLGTERARTRVNGTVYQTCTSLAFGDGQSCTAADPTPYHFTGKERDPETGNDHAWFRNYANSQGRWLSPDPLPHTKRRWYVPQSLNQYAYVQNNPLKYVDPLGLDIWLANDTEEGRKKAQAKITKNMTAQEAANIGYRKNKEGNFEMFVKDPNKVNLSKASAGYKDLVGLINDRSIVANVGLVGNGLTATLPSLGGKVSSYGGGGLVTQPEGKRVDVLVQQGNLPGGVKVIGPSGKEVMGVAPDYITMAHELFGETMKYRAGHEDLRNDPHRDSEVVIGIENEIREFHGLLPRSVSGHGITTVEVEE